MADHERESRPIDTTAFGDEWRRTSNSPVSKGNVDVYPKQLILKCGKIEIISENGNPKTTRIYIDGKLARGIYDMVLHFNTRSLGQFHLSVYLGEFQFELTPKEKNQTKGG